MTPQWVTTETTSKITVKGLFVVVDVRDHLREATETSPAP